MADSELQKRLEQLGRRLVDDVEAWERSTRAQRKEVVTQLATHLSEELSHAIGRLPATREERRALKRARRAQRRAEHRERERSEASAAVGVVMLIAAVGMAVFAVIRPELFWLVFVAMGIGIGGAKQLSLARERDRAALAQAPPAATRAPATPEATTTPVHEIDVLCEALLADLKTAPEAVRQFVQAPEKTIATLRSTAKALDARRQQLLAERPRDRLAAIAAQREGLEARIQAASDPPTRAKLSQAVASLDGQRSALEQLATFGERVDGEYTSLYVSLQELRTRVSVARSAASGVQIDGVRLSVERLNDELEAITSALESVSVSGERLSPIAPIADPGAEGGRLEAGPERQRH